MPMYSMFFGFKYASPQRNLILRSKEYTLASCRITETGMRHRGDTAGHRGLASLLHEWVIKYIHQLFEVGKLYRSESEELL